MWNPLNILFNYSRLIDFEIAGDPERALARLSRSANKSALVATFTGEHTQLVGSVSKDYVRLHKVTPLFGNIFKPIFVGNIQSRDSKAYLVGSFRMGFIGRAVITVFIFFVVTLQVMLLPVIVTDGIEVLQPTLFLAGGIIFFF
jgi:hypothetical protein